MTYAVAAAHNCGLVRRVPAILLLIAFAALGSGLLEGVHQRAHAMQRAAAAAAAGHSGADSSLPAHGDEEGCELCANLHLPRIGAGYVPMLVCLGLFVAFLSQIAPQLASQRVVARVDCRGPPVL